MPSTFFQRKIGGFYVSMQEKLLVPPTWKCHLGATFPRGKAYFSKITTVYSLKLPFGYFEPFNCNIRSFCRRANISHIYMYIYYQLSTYQMKAVKWSTFYQKENHNFKSNIKISTNELNSFWFWTNLHQRQRVYITFTDAQIGGWVAVTKNGNKRKTEIFTSAKAAKWASLVVQ